ncbi:MAG TPA: hypothetical protein VN950_03665 [Terriglobales bacterium]|nr:hypothetical protein [Terriglobales bacterium]
MQNVDQLEVGRLAALLQKRNEIDAQIAGLIGRPSLLGHIGEWIAAAIFGINLNDSAIHQGFDGHFTGPPFEGRTVNAKLYGIRQNLLDMKEVGQPQPDFYLAMTGPRDLVTSSRGCHRPCVVREVFLFETEPLLQRLIGQVKIGTSTSLREKEWEAARIFPEFNKSTPMTLRRDQVTALESLSGGV